MKIYANKRTKVAHSSGSRGDACRQAFVLKANVKRFESLEEAEAGGYRACKRCKPE